MSTTIETQLQEKIYDQITEIMESKVESVIGEDGLTVWDFAELRDSLIEYHSQALESVKRETEKEREELILKVISICSLHMVDHKYSPTEFIQAIEELKV